MTDLSKFFFLPLQFDNAESLNMVKTLNPVKYGTCLFFAAVDDFVVSGTLLCMHRCGA
jgi:hypothetical protein